ncbi:hypothetical protein HZS_619 [Henneguya salminicola]|nr:hypothetical protein HZS_619 [Henneguya salminicola]
MENESNTIDNCPKIKNEESDFNLDEEELIERAKSYKMTAKHVKSLIFNVCTDPNVVDFAVKSADKSEDLLEKWLPTSNIRITRNALKSTGCYNLKDKKLEEQFNEENDPDYLPPQLEDNLKIPEDDRKEIPPQPEVISFRTRSHPFFDNTPITPLEANLETKMDEDLPPEKLPDNLDPDEIEWLKWLTEFKTSGRTQLKLLDFKIADNIDDQDEDFKLTYEDLDQEDEEEYRDDKAVIVSHREIQMLLNELEDEEIDFCIVKNRPQLILNAYCSLFNRSDELNQMLITKDDEDQIVSHIQQYIQLLVQMYMLGTFYNENAEAAKHAKYFLDEISYFTPSSIQTPQLSHPDRNSERTPLRVFKQSNIAEALKVIKDWDDVIGGLYTSVLFGASPANSMTHNTDINYASTLKIIDWSDFKFPPLPIKMMNFFLIENFFSLYPSIIPTTGLKLSTTDSFQYYKKTDARAYNYLETYSDRFPIPKNLKFSHSENLLLMIGYFQFGEDYVKIHLNSLPTRLPSRIRSKFRYMLQNPSTMGLNMKMMLMRGYFDTSCIDSNEITETISDVPRECLARRQDDPIPAPAWVNLARNPKYWKMTPITYEYINDSDIKSMAINTAITASSNKIGLALIPSECLIVRNSQFDINLLYQKNINKSRQNILSMSLSDLPLYDLGDANTLLEKIYKNIGRSCAIKFNLNRDNLSWLFSDLIFHLFKLHCKTSESYDQFLCEVSGMQTLDPSTVLSKLVIEAVKRDPILAKKICYIFGIKNKNTSVSKIFIIIVSIQDYDTEIEYEIGLEELSEPPPYLGDEEQSLKYDEQQKPIRIIQANDSFSSAQFHK